MPAWPLVSSHTKGWLGYSQRETVAGQVEAAKAAKAVYRDKIAASDLAKWQLNWQTPHCDTPDNIRNHPILRGLNIPVPFDVRAFTAAIAAQRGRPIHLMPVSGLTGVCGLWIATDTAAPVASAIQ